MVYSEQERGNDGVKLMRRSYLGRDERLPVGIRKKVRKFKNMLFLKQNSGRPVEVIKVVERN